MNRAPFDPRWLRPELVASWPEIVLVMVLSTGCYIASSAWNAAHGSSHHYLTLLLTDRRMAASLALESALLGLLVLYLRRRGWTPGDLRIQPGIISTLMSFGLTAAMYAAHATVVFGLMFALFRLQTQYPHFLEFIQATGPQLHPHSVAITWTALISAVVFNAFFEEITCTAYMFNQFAAKLGPFAGLLLTVMVRMAYHTYEGPVQMLSIGMVFLVTGVAYWWTRNLWPLIVAHALVDLGSMALLKVVLT